MSGDTAEATNPPRDLAAEVAVLRAQYAALAQRLAALEARLTDDGR